ncbi:SDR family oxidoreductase [Bradyrhizobium betae]|uniref:SDR family oxidoreductase n=1 Tax=Bradyrhizobium betae TaxID=244734 RepID=UPI003D673883
MVLRAAAGAVPVSTMRETPSARHLRDRLTSIFSDVLKHRQFGPQDRFFEIGGNSLLLIILAGKLTQSFEHEITPIDVLDNPTLDGLARLLQSRLGVVLDASDGQRPTNEKITDNRIAVIGRAGRFPNAACVDDFWRRTSEGVIDIRTLDEQPEGLLPYRGVLDGVDRFDSGFFGVPEGEARLLDPQQRFILEVTQEALDDAAFDPRQSNAVVSVYAACGPAREIEESGSLSAQYERTLATAPDFTATRISYRFDLRGESVTVQTGCSSSLVAVHMACESLLSRKSDVALAGGVSIAANQQLGYAVEDGMITSPTGRCCPFDVRANGTVPGSAVGMVAMMRLADAVDQGAPIQAVILGSAINNDGASKVGFMAPSPSGQAAVITAALGRSNIGGDSLGYIETHGTGTRLGDQAEIEGLGRAIRPLDGHDIALGSVKANYGHLDRAAGIVGLLRAIEAVKHGVIPPLAGFEQPDEDLALAARGFYVPTRATGWPEQNHPRRAGVSSFGVGGTNAHVIVEQAPELPTARPVLTPVPIVISAASPGSLKTTRLRLAQHIETGPPGNLNGLARSLFEGRRHQKFRQAFVATDPGELCRQLQFEAPNHVEAAVSPSLVWLFPGQGDATVDGFKALYDNQRVYRAALDECANLVRQYSDIDVINLLFGAQPDASRFEDMGCFQPVMFAVQYALSDFCESLGVQPGALIGHSLGEVVAATRAGVFKLEDAVAFVIKRGQLMQLTRPGAMISVTLPPSRMARYLLPGTSIAAYNGRELVAISGLSEPVAELEAKLIADGISVRPLAIPRAAHCSQMQETARELGRFVSTLQLTPPRIPIVSNVTGGWADVGMATADYWARHIEMPVRFVESLNCVAETGRVLGLIVGPGNTMRRLVAHEMEERAVDVVELSTDAPHALDTLNSLWCAGANVNVWAATENPATAKVSLPPTVFDHRFSWPFREVANKAPTSLQVSRQDDSGAWLWQTKTTAVKSSSRQTREVRCRLLNHPDGMVESLIRSLSGLRPVENLSEATDVIWWIDHLDPSALQVQLRAIAERAEQELRVWIIAGRSEPLCLDRPTDRAIGLGIVRAGALEHPKSSWHVVDVAGSSDMASDIAAAIDLADPPTTLKAGLDGLAAVRPEHAWPDWRSRPLRDDGCYIITGGAGRVASALVKAIRREVAAPIVLLGRQPFESVQPRLTSLANNVVYRQLDVTDAAGTAELFTELRSEYARINGVIHAAGETDTRRFATLATLEASSWAEISAAKLRGTSAIAAALRPDEADFVLLCSSLSTAIGGVGFASYIAANATLDEYAESRWERGDKRWISVGWEAWTEGDARTDIGPARYALDDEDGYHAFMRCLCVRGPVVLISTAPIDARIDEIREQVGRTSVPSSQILGAVAASPSPAVAVENVLRAVLGRIPDDPERDLREEAIESLTILQIVTRLRKSLKIELSLMDVMRNLSVNGLRHLVETAIGSVPRDGEFEIVRVPEAASYPTSSAQRRWLILMPEKYGGLDIVVHVAGNVTLGALTAAVRSTIERHSGLRTTFTFRGGKWLQHIVSTICVEEVDLRQEVYWKSTLRAIAKEKSERWYEAEAISPPFEIVVAALPDGQFALVIHGHHVIFDGWSSSIFLKEIADAVAGRGSRQPFQYVDYATAQQNYLAGPAILPVRKYWQRHFADAPVPTRVRGFADVETAEDNGDVLPFLLDQKVVELLAHRALGLHATTFMLFAAAYGLVLSRLTGSFDLIFGTTAAARPTPQSEEIIGVFVNPLPLRLKFSADQSLESYLETVKQVLTGFHENQNYPLEDLLKHVPSFRNCDLNSTFHCYLLYQNYWRAPEDVLRFRRLNLEASGHHKLMREFEIVLEDEDGSVHGELWYRASRFTPQQACLWRDMFVSCVADISTADLQVTVAKLLQKFVIDT